MRVARVVPVEVDVVVLLEAECWIPEQLEEVPVKEPLHVLWPGLDSQVGNVLGHLDGHFQLGESLPELRQRPQGIPCLLRGHVREELANVVVGELPHRPLHPVDVEHDLPPGGEHLRETAERVSSGRRVVEDALREDRVEALRTERRVRDVTLDEVHSAHFPDPVAGDVDRNRDVQSDPFAVAPLLPAGLHPERGRVGTSAAGIEAQPPVAEEVPQVLLALEPVALQKPVEREAAKARGVIRVALLPLVAEALSRPALVAILDLDEARDSGEHGVGAPFGAAERALDDLVVFLDDLRAELERSLRDRVGENVDERPTHELYRPSRARRRSPR